MSISVSPNQSRSTFSKPLSFLWVHLISFFGFLSFVTLPTNVLLTKYFGLLPVKLSGIILAISVVAVLLLKGQKRTYLRFLIFFAAFGYFVAAFFRLDIVAIFVESIPVLEFIGAILVFSAINEAKDFRVLVVYLVSCLWVSMFVELAMITGVIENPFGSRASFSGRAISDVGIGRFVTPTHLLAGTCIGVVGYLWLSKRIPIKTSAFILLPSLVIAGLASTRLLVVLIFLPILAAAFLRQNKKNRLRLLGLSLVIAISPFIVNLLSQTLLPQIEFLSQYISNFSARFFSTFISGDLSETDSSSFYRSQEVHFATQYVSSHPFFGGGFSANFMSSPIVADNSFLGLHGNSYSHNTYLWILIKTGFVGLIIFLAGVGSTLVRRKRTPLSYESHLFLSVLVSLLIIAFIWNILANSPDSTLFGGILGLFISSNRSTGLISSALVNEGKAEATV